MYYPPKKKLLNKHRGGRNCTSNGPWRVCAQSLSTDLCCHSFPEVSDYPLLWVTDSQQVAPFGGTLRIAGLAQ